MPGWTGKIAPAALESRGACARSAAARLRSPHFGRNGISQGLID